MIDVAKQVIQRHPEVKNEGIPEASALNSSVNARQYSPSITSARIIPSLLRCPPERGKITPVLNRQPYTRGATLSYRGAFLPKLNVSIPSNWYEGVGPAPLRKVCAKDSDLSAVRGAASSRFLSERPPRTDTAEPPPKSVR